MYNASISAFPDKDIAILSAAVADYRPTDVQDKKMKRRDSEDITIRLTPNPDIAATLGKMKSKKQQIIGFALETNNEESNAIKKIEKKNFNYIVLNSLNDSGAGFGHDTNKITIISKEGDKRSFNLKSKKEDARAGHPPYIIYSADYFLGAFLRTSTTKSHHLPTESISHLSSGE